ncbi:helix-turn-helix transcriptional regulator [Nocardia sp. NPDC004604]|uniref:helix-turn-helix transcriptional regulator n=1 Tax=Nocardia sp. NPDC004604 TaxID=3157013 RepID=UPI0033AA5686
MSVTASFDRREGERKLHIHARLEHDGALVAEGNARFVAVSPDSPEYPWTLSELADQAGASIRSVQQAFRNYRGCSPLEMLRMVRLERAHQNLVDPGPNDTVSIFAARWGFSNMGRFASAYRRRYQVNPSEALRGLI